MTDQVLAKAQEKFVNHLYPAERKLFEEFGTVQTVKFSEENRFLRADRLSWLCREFWKLCLPHGIDIQGAYISGSLDLRFAKIEVPLRFSNCQFNKALLLKQAELKELDLSGSHILYSDEVNFPGNPPEPTSILASEIKVEGSIYLSNGFIANGCVNLQSAEIGGSLMCTKKSTLIQQNSWVGYALLAANINVKGNVNLSEGFTAVGEVSLYGAEIGGNLQCIKKSTFNNSNRNALQAVKINVRGSVHLEDDFEANGRVNFQNAEIGGNLQCIKESTFNNEGGDALMAQSINVKGGVLLQDDFKAIGKVSFVGAEIGGNLQCIKESTFNNEGGHALQATGINVKGNVNLSEGFTAVGEVNLENVEIGGTLQISKVENPETMNLDLQFARVQTLDYYENSFPESGNLYLNGLTYEALGTESLNSYSGKQLLDWLELQPDENFSFQPYTQLSKVLQSSGKENIATQILIAKENRRYDIIENPLEQIWGEILRITIAYGYCPWLAFIWALIIVGNGLFAFKYGFEHNSILPTDKDCKDIDKCKNYPKFDPLVYSIDVFLPIIDLRLKNAWLPNANKDYGGILRYYFWFQTLAGWGLTTIWVAGFTGLVRNNNK